MYVLHTYRDGKRDPVVLARFELVDGRIRFDESDGDPEIVATFKAEGFRGSTVLEGEAFLANLEDAFSGGTVFLNDEELFDRTRSLWDYAQLTATPAAS